MAQKKTFETNMDELEKIISDLESGEAPLDKCIELFENGVKLSGECLKMINDARQKITLLTENGETEFGSAEVKDE
jgi:exodeoxyribonuclease VII small subunit